MWGYRQGMLRGKEKLDYMADYFLARMIEKERNLHNVQMANLLAKRKTGPLGLRG